MKPEYKKLDIIKDIIFFFLTVAVAYGYSLLMLLILSFAASRYLPMQFEDMLVYAGIGAAVTGVWDVIKKIKKYRRN